MSELELPAKTPERGRGQRAGLDLERIMKVARGFEHSQLSMQTLADALNVDRKALNYHVKDRQTLLGLVAKEAFDETFDPQSIASASSWEVACRAYAYRFVESVVNLGALAEHLWFGDPLSDLTLVPAEALFEQLRKAGFTDEVSVRLVTLLVTLCLGHARDILQVASELERPRPRTLKAALVKANPADFENLTRISRLGVDTYSREQLDFAVDVVIDGSRKHLPASSSNAQT